MYQISDAVVCLIGIGTVFVGLIALIFLCKIISSIVQASEKRKSAAIPCQKDAQVPTPPADSSEQTKIAIRAALAEYLKEDISNIKISSFRKM